MSARITVIALVALMPALSAGATADRIGILPGLGEPDSVVTPLGEMVLYDLATGTRTRVAAGEYPDLPERLFTTAPIKALYGDPGPGASPDKNFNGWTMVGDPTFGTYPRHVKLRMRSITALGDTIGGQCSGTLISPRHVLTAGHCVYYHMEDGFPLFDFADQVTVTPGFENGSGPWGNAQATQIMSWSGWIDNEDRDHDVALVTLDRPMGAFVGWRNYGYDNDPAHWDDPFWTITGYPAEAPFDGQTQWTTSGDFDSVWGNQIGFNQPSWGGSSGSGSIKGGVAWGVLTASDRESHTTITRLTSTKFGDIQTRIAIDQPNSPDLWPLQVITSASGGTIDAGATFASFFFRIHNFSAAQWSGPIPYQVFLSENRNISGGDIEIHSGTLNLTIPANGTEGVTVPSVQVNPNVPANGYYVGVRLNISDAGPGNDTTGTSDVDSLTVACPQPGSPWMGLPADDATCLPTAGVQLAWGNVPDAVFYRLSWGRVGSSLQSVDVAGTQYTLPQLLPGKTYIWLVRAVNACGTFSNGGPTYSFTTADVPPAPTVTFPADGDMCQPAYQVVVDWDDVPGATGYQIRVMSSCGFPVTPISTTLSAYPILGLNDNQTYFYQVRTKGACGNYGEWSECRSFTTRPSVLGVPQQFFPPEGYGCVVTPTGVSWEAIDGADAYEVVFGQTCAGTDTVGVATNVAQLPVAGPGTWYWKVRARRCGFTGDWSACHSFQVDAAAPDTARNFAAISHEIGVWSSEPQVTLKWDDVVDPGPCGIVFYELDWTEGDQPPPLPWQDNTTGQPYTTPPLPDGADTWLHLWVRDAATNYAPAPQSLGPFRIDTTGPFAPQVTTVPPAGGFTADAGISASWTTPADAGSGFAGFRHGLVSQASESLPPVPLTTATDADYGQQAEGLYYLRLAPFDSLGNAGDTLTVGPLGVDKTAPVATIDRPYPGTVLTHMQTVIVLYTATDNLSGVAWLEFTYTDNGETWMPVRSGAPGQFPGGFAWVVPYSPSGTIRMRLRAIDGAGNESVFEQSRDLVVVNTTGVGDGNLPRRAAIAAVHPNPFNPRTTIRYGVPRAGHVRLTVHDATGRLVRTLVSGHEEAGWRERKWNGLDDSGRQVASGVYFSRLEAAGGTAVRRMTLLK